MCASAAACSHLPAPCIEILFLYATTVHLQSGSLSDSRQFFRNFSVPLFVMGCLIVHFTWSNFILKFLTKIKPWIEIIRQWSTSSNCKVCETTEWLEVVVIIFSIIWSTRLESTISDFLLVKTDQCGITHHCDIEWLRILPIALYSLINEKIIQFITPVHFLEKWIAGKRFRSLWFRE